MLAAIFGINASLYIRSTTIFRLEVNVRKCCRLHAVRLPTLVVGSLFGAFSRSDSSVTVMLRALTLLMWQDLEGQVAGQGEGMQELAGRTHQLVEENEQARGVTDGRRLFRGLGGRGRGTSVCRSLKLRGARDYGRYLGVLARKRVESMKPRDLGQSLDSSQDFQLSPCLSSQPTPL